MPSKNFSEYPIYTPENSPFSKKVEVRLLAVSTAPLDIDEFSPEEWTALNAATTIAGEAALTCYSANLLTPLDYLKRSIKHKDKVKSVAGDTRDSGHHSTREHKNYIFAVANLSRNAIYKLHSQPFHVTDQESQRYVTMSEESVVLPRTGNEVADHIIETAANELFEGYVQLSAILEIDVKTHYLKRFPGKRTKRWADDVAKESNKKAQEIARYLLPLSMGANLYHSVNELTLIRLAKMYLKNDSEPELKLLVQSLVDAAASLDPTLLDEIGKPLDFPNSTEENFYQNTPIDPYAAADEIDRYLDGLPGRLDHDQGLDSRLARAVRLTLGASENDLSDIDAIDLVLNPQNNPILASVNGEMVIHQLSRALNQVSLSGVVTLSHVIDSQLQRHRGLAQTRPLILPIPRLQQDIVVPILVAQNPQALDLYLRLQANNIKYMETLAQMDIDQNTLSYLHTNATRIRKSINGPLGAFHHLWRLRTCLNAQEENYNLAIAMVKQLPDISPIIAQHFEKPAPCGVRIRAGLPPVCPEGKRYCGVPVWKKTIVEYPDRDI